MELKDFVKRTLIDIIQGVKDAQAVNGVAEYVVPRGSFACEFTSDRRVAKGGTSLVEFDVAVTVETARSKKGDIKIVVVQGSGETATKNVSSSRVKFSIPMIFPESPLDRPDESRRSNQ